MSVPQFGHDCGAVAHTMVPQLKHSYVDSSRVSSSIVLVGMDGYASVAYFRPQRYRR
ncbi:Zn finger protein, C2C2 type [Natrarchaeobaculum sulfurireducens]|uniref:Zn finger protein, C2C2 type n=1 Tax=Natrarchaeobaculum sulfurireducens TaxID=2044521 RepID=A0A346PCJ1_9EURY|nr:Zn finger protein, C2C2 type [Natrarchaeobaculum sulfurireducens]